MLSTLQRHLVFLAVAVSIRVAAAEPTATLPLGPGRLPGIEGVAGIVTEFATSQPVQAVEVVATGLDVKDRIATVTTPEGLFHFPSLTPGNYEVWTQIAGHARSAHLVRVVSGNAALVDMVVYAASPTGLIPPYEAAVAAQPPVAQDGPLRLELRAPRASYALGEPIALFALFRNQGRQPVVVAKALDGSLDERRNSPRYRAFVTRLPAGGPPVRVDFRHFGCGNVNPTFGGDVVELKPDETADPFDFLDEYHFRAGHLRVDGLRGLDRPGRVRIWIDYSQVGLIPANASECVYARPDSPGQMALPLPIGVTTEQLRAQHTPLPQRAPLQVEGLRSNSVEFNIVESLDDVGIMRVPAPVAPPLRTARLVVRVFDELGSALPRATVDALGIRLIKSDGVYTQERALPGRYEVVARDVNGDGLGMRMVDLSEGVTSTVDFHRPGFGSLRLSFKNPSGAEWVRTDLYEGQVPMPATYSALRSKSPGRWGGRSTTDPTFQKLPVGKYTLFVHRFFERDLYSVLRRDIEVRVHEDQVLTINLSETDTLLPYSSP